jgi:hypothetical protein
MEIMIFTKGGWRIEKAVIEREAEVQTPKRDALLKKSESLSAPEQDIGVNLKGFVPRMGVKTPDF